MSESIVVRDMAVTDAPEVARLLSMLGYSWTADEIALRLAAFLDGGERGLVATRGRADPDAPLLGALTLHITPVLHRTGPVGRLTALVVDEAARGQGVGCALVEAAERHFVARGCVVVEVTSHKKRTDAHAFYARMGYEATSLRFGKPLTSAE